MSPDVPDPATPPDVAPAASTDPYRTVSSDDPYKTSSTDDPHKTSEPPPPTGLRPPWLRAGGEPVPGYRLTQSLGKGGFGEVWQADGPGGVRVAFKFVSLARSAGDLERQALEIIKQVRHPNLLFLFGTWERDDYLVIGMELADRTLKDRHDEVKAGGGAGIPRGELLRYSQDVAKVLDFLNKPRHFPERGQPVGIQHGDVKPQNILLVSDSVKVGDFGLMRLLEQVTARHEGGMTPAYAAPEIFAGRTSRWADQYSMAVTYCQLRGGKLPYKQTPSLLAGERPPDPDLSSLPEAERAAVRRALDVEPHRRWPNCRAFVKELVEAGRRAAGRPGDSSVPRPAAPEPRAAAVTPPAGPAETTGSAPTQLQSKPPAWSRPAGAPKAAAVPAKSGLRLAVAAGVLAVLGLTAGGFLAYRAGLFGGRMPMSKAYETKAMAEAPVGEPRVEAKSAGDSTPVASAPAPPPPALPPPLPTRDERVAQELGKAETDVKALLAAGNFAAAVERVRSAVVAAERVRDGGLSEADRAWANAQLNPIVTEWRAAADREPNPERKAAMIKELAAAYEAAKPRVFAAKSAAKSAASRDTDTTARPPDAAPAKGARLAGGTGLGTNTAPRAETNSAEPTGASVPLAGQAPPTTASRSEWVNLILGLLGVAALVVVAMALARRLRRVPKPAASTATQGPPRSLTAATPPAVGAAVPSAHRLLEGHQDTVWSVAGLGGGRVLSGGMDHTVRVWDAANGRETLILTGHTDGVLCVAAAADGATALSAGLDGTVRLWDLASGRETVSLDVGAGRLSAAAFVAGDRQSVLAGGDDGTLRLWDVAGRVEIRRFAGHSQRVTSLAVSPDGRLAASGSDDRTARLWDVATGRELHRLSGHGAAVLAVAFAPDGRHLVTGGGDHVALWWDVADGRLENRFAGHTDWVRGVTVTPDGRHVLTGGDDELMILWDVGTGEPRRHLAGHLGSVLGVAVAPDGRFAYSAGDDWTVGVWDLNADQSGPR
jgi:serine/threonine protein kinase